MEFKNPKYIPCRIVISWPLWNTYREKLERIVMRYPLIFRGFKVGSIHYDEKIGVLGSNEERIDVFGCKWHFPLKGLQGVVVKHPLSDWNNLKNFKLLDPEDGVPTESRGLIPWNKIYDNLEKSYKSGSPVIASMPHSFFFQRLYYLRGYTNLLKDFIKKPPRIYQLVEMLTEYNLELIKRMLKFKHLDMIAFGDDLGNQYRMPISPKTFRVFIYPAYKKIFTFIRSHGIHVYLHSDGHVMEIVDQLIDTGLSVLNIHDLVNGIKNIAESCMGKICIDIDIDRQRIVPYGNPSQIKKHIKNIVETLARKDGGLMMTAGLYSPTPLENIKALIEAINENMWL